MNPDETGQESAKSFFGQKPVQAEADPKLGKPAERANQKIGSGRRAKGSKDGAFQPVTGEALTKPYHRYPTENCEEVSHGNSD